jgi:CheY-like chemotaxis protein/MinD-like ATPase involved in chromosome partitioning or flagellar assembly
MRMPEKVLVVDDDLETLRLVGLMLQRQGFVIVAANNGAQALSQARAEQPDLIILDIMMPDMDGYAVARQLRKEPETASIPILMFTAKGMVEDKVAGYEAGADEYLTKPIHPVELVTRLRTLLVRGKTHPPAPIPSSADQGYMIGVVSPKGGVGVSTLVLNLAISYHNKTKGEVIAAEMRPGHGTWGLELGFANPTGLNDLLAMRTADITNQVVEKTLMQTTFGVRCLLASPHPKDIEAVHATDQVSAVLKILPLLAPLVLLDIGANVWPNFGLVLSQCQELIVVTEPYPGMMPPTRVFIEELVDRGFGKNKLMTLVMVNRVRADVQLSVTQVQENLGRQVVQVIPPAPELAYQAALRGMPLIQVQPEGLLAQQFSRLADVVATRVKK